MYSLLSRQLLERECVLRVSKEEVSFCARHVHGSLVFGANHEDWIVLSDQENLCSGEIYKLCDVLRVHVLIVSLLAP